MKRIWVKIDTLFGYLFSLTVLLVGLGALYALVWLPLSHRGIPRPDEVLLAVGVLFVGGSFFELARRRTKSSRWFLYANISFWFLAYSSLLTWRQVAAGARATMHELIFAVAMAALTAVFALLTYRSWKKERSS